jgi:Trp operon repressor
MDEEKDCYLVHRVYNSKERQDLKDRSHIYGWTTDKRVLKAFLKQRDPKKYTVSKIEEDQIPNALGRYVDEIEEFMINFIKLKSAQTGEEFNLFMTENEKNEVEKRIERIFEDLSSIDVIDGEILHYVNILINIKTKYSDALNYLGYRPKEIDAVFDSYVGEVMYERSYSSYDGISCEEFYHDPRGSYGTSISSLSDISNKIIYSIESFIKAMKDDL